MALKLKTFFQILYPENDLEFRKKITQRASYTQKKCEKKPKILAKKTEISFDDEKYFCIKPVSIMCSKFVQFQLSISRCSN